MSDDIHFHEDDLPDVLRVLRLHNKSLATFTDEQIMDKMRAYARLIPMGEPCHAGTDGFILSGYWDSEGRWLYKVSIAAWLVKDLRETDAVIAAYREGYGGIKAALIAAIEESKS